LIVFYIFKLVTWIIYLINTRRCKFLQRMCNTNQYNFSPTWNKDNSIIQICIIWHIMNIIWTLNSVITGYYDCIWKKLFFRHYMRNVQIMFMMCQIIQIWIIELSLFQVGEKLYWFVLLQQEKNYYDGKVVNRHTVIMELLSGHPL
jgi:hypothetical protein